MNHAAPSAFKGAPGGAWVSCRRASLLAEVSLFSRNSAQNPLGAAFSARKDGASSTIRQDSQARTDAMIQPTSSGRPRNPEAGACRA